MDSTSAPTTAPASTSRQPESVADVDPRSHTALSGGATTIFDATANAFGQAAPNLSVAELTRHVQGDAIFSAPFSPDRSSPFPGLGPMFENRSCE
ncbi:MAG TPA: di-heme oxidoredictase family protein, partial [Gemmatimonadaceae bacterium]